MENAKEIAYYTSITAMEPLFPEDDSKRLEKLAFELIEKTARLSGTLNPITRKAIADFLRPMNSYYSNLIEGHDTHPIDIDKALSNNYSNDKDKRDLQLEAKAHIGMYEAILHKFETETPLPKPTESAFLKFVHSGFYDHLPEEFKTSKTESGVLLPVLPGQFRTTEVKVGKHVAPGFAYLAAFIKRFEEFYNPEDATNSYKIRRVISVAASHHRLAWIHPFLDGNGRVIRLFSDAFFMYENLSAGGLWSISRGLARSKETYQAKLANADLLRYNSYDGRGNLSNKMLEEFCHYFLETAIDQVDYMYKTLDTETMINRMESFVDLMVHKGKLRTEAKYILTETYLKGRISKKEAMRITNTSDKTLKLTIDKLIEYGLIEAIQEGVSMMYYIKFSIKFSPLLFPGLYPSQKEIDLMIAYS